MTNEISDKSDANQKSQAVRTLKLLEQHHEKVSQLLKFRNSKPANQPVESPSESKSIVQISPSSPAEKPPEGSHPRSQQPNSSLPHIPQREIGSSIASNLATARGIPSNRQRRGVPPVTQPSQSSESKTLTPPRRSRPREPVPKLAESLNPKKIQDSQTPNPKKPQDTQTPKPLPLTPTTSSPNAKISKPNSDNPSPSPRSDEPFQRFYATFEGLFSKLSAPLAFAGLPLNLEEPQTQPQPSKPNSNNPNPSKPEEHATAEPNFTKIYSKAALRAVHDEYGGAHGGPFGGAESFYVVPTTGGTISYADILARVQQDATRQTPPEPNNTDDQFDDEFVDARETPQAASPALTRNSPNHKPGTKTLEELTLENDALRALADHLSKRLVEFEMGAQTSSLALQRSIRAMTSPAASDAGGGDGRADGRVVVLEEQVRAAEREVARMGKENEKLKGVVGRYRERWEKLKEGARVRREGTGDGG